MRESAELRMTPGSRSNGNGNGNCHEMPASIVATATAVPPHLITAEDVKKHIQSIFHLEGSRLDGMFSIVDNSHIKQRHTIFPLDYTVQPRPLTQTSLEYQEHAIRLGKQVAEDCLARAGMKPEEIDWIITVSCTGYMIPSLDAYLIESMGFRRDVRRLPITEMGCAAGFAASLRNS
jgi:predicted naringenin-chalcone synthase